MHRLISFFMAMLVAFLSCVPCSDAGASPATGEGIATIKAADGCDSGHHQCTPDECSPFCSCSCCAAVSIPEPLVIRFPAAMQLFSTVRTTMEERPIAGTFVPVWQPPRLS